VLDLGEDATGGKQLATSNNRHYHLRNVKEDAAVGLCLEKYRRLKQNAVGSSVGWDLKPSQDLIAVRVKIEDGEIAPCPRQMEAPSFRRTRARLFALKPSYGWTVNLPSKRALMVACSGQLDGERTRG
jgi:hypothetical protein